MAVNGLLETSKIPIYASDRSLIGILGIAHDVTRRHESELALRESEQHYRTLANGGSTLIWTSGIDKPRNYFNEPWLRFTGRTLQQEAADGWTESVHPDDLAACRDLCQCVRSDNRRSAWNTGYVMPMATIAGFATTVVRAMTASASFSGTSGFASTSARKKRRKSSCNLHRAHLQALVSERTKALADALALIKLNEERYSLRSKQPVTGFGTGTLCQTCITNPAYSQMLGYAPDELKQGPELVLPICCIPMTGSPFSIPAVVASGQVGYYEIEFRMRSKDGSYKWILSRGKVARRDADGHPVRAVGTHIDLTVRKLTEMELQRAKEAAESAAWPRVPSWPA
jgi:PAS domain-containing protein